MKNLYLISKEDFINLIKNPMWLFYQTVFPILLVFIMGFLTKDNYGSEITSYDYYVISLMIYGLINSCMTSANAFMEERIKKPNMRIIYAPGSVKNIFISKIIASFVFCALLHFIDMVILCLIFKVTIHGILHLVILFGLTELFSVTLGITMCCIFKTEQLSNQILTIVVNIIAILGGLLFSLDGYGSIIRNISLLSPAKWIRDAAFQMIYDNNFNLFLPCAVIMTVATIILIIICNFTFRKEDCIC